jgi:hypothetical protein
VWKLRKDVTFGVEEEKEKSTTTIDYVLTVAGIMDSWDGRQDIKGDVEKSSWKLFRKRLNFGFGSSGYTNNYLLRRSVLI